PHPPLSPAPFPHRWMATLRPGPARGARCRRDAQAAGAIASDASPQALAQVFWIGWEGAVMRARLVQSAAPLNQYWDFFAHSMTTKTPAQDGASADNPLPTRNTLS
ncbi:TetR family transcriptional regulator, partial [Klebsiella pneumoniae]